MSYAPTVCRTQGVAMRAQKIVGVLVPEKQPAPAHSFGHALRAGVVCVVSPPPTPQSRSRGSRCAARSRAPVPAPVRPRWGLPKVKSERPSTSTGALRAPQCRQRPHQCLSLYTSCRRVSPRGARDTPALHRMSERVLFVAVKGSLRRAARALDGIGGGDGNSSG